MLQPVDDAECQAARKRLILGRVLNEIRSASRQRCVGYLASAASGTNSFAGDPRGGVGGEKDGYGGDILRFA